MPSCSIRLTLIDANHCPGAVMVVAEFPSPGRRPVIHTGDCRCGGGCPLRPRPHSGSDVQCSPAQDQALARGSSAARRSPNTNHHLAETARLCRLVEEMQDNAVLRGVRSKQPVLVLDTTYCSPEVCLTPCAAPSDALYPSFTSQRRLLPASKVPSSHCLFIVFSSSNAACLLQCDSFVEYPLITLCHTLQYTFPSQRETLEYTLSKCWGQKRLHCSWHV